MKRILIAGGSGFVGEHLRRKFLSEFAEVYILTTQPRLALQSNFIYWQPYSNRIDWKNNQEFDTIINLCGANIGDKFWTKNRKIELEKSRIESTLFLRKLIEDKQLKTDFFIQFSAIGFYGNRGFFKLGENDTKGDGFLANLTHQWEQTMLDFNCPHTILRLGVVFHPSLGAFPKLIMGLKYRFSVILGKGNQYISWIDVNDLCDLVSFCEKYKLIGVYNAVSPQPVQLFYLLKKVQRKLGGISIPFIVPVCIVRFLFRDFSELFLFSQKVNSRKIEHENFQFKTKNLNEFILKYNKKWR